MNKTKPAKGKTGTPDQKKHADDRSAEQRLLDCLVEPLRTTEERDQSRAATHESDEAVEQMLASPVILSNIAKAQNAFVAEHWPRLLRKLFDAAKKGEAWAWKILLDVAGVAEQLRIASGDEEASSALPKEICALLSRADEQAKIPDSDASAV
jgi:hypothetical protein